MNVLLPEDGGDKTNCPLMVPPSMVTVPEPYSFEALAFLPPPTEPVFRVLCDVKGNNSAEEHELLDWERSMILKADKI